MKRNRQQTEKRILTAAISLISEVGFHTFGVNAVAARAGVDKVLIYRYFSGLDGLLDFIGKTEVLFPSAATVANSDICQFFKDYCAAVSNNPLTLQLHHWERVIENPLTLAYRKQHEVFWVDVTGLLRPQNEEARAILDALAVTRVNGISSEKYAPLVKHTQFVSVSPMSAAPEVFESEERLADNLL
ncbi:MAG: helix-turn-helix domain-containing protein [Verrucomicrobiota bacterium]